jgi:ribosomal RNA assembly protein
MIVDKIARIIRNKKKLEEKLKIKLSNRGKEIKIEGEPNEEYIAEKVIDALDFGFPFSVAFLIKTDDFVFETLNIKDYTKRGDLNRVRGRIIGKNGVTLRVLNQLTKCYFEMKDNQIGIICSPEHLGGGQDAIISIIRGSKQSNVYNFLEQHQVKPVLDLGLKHRKS